jgi:hypothetical protein
MFNNSYYLNMSEWADFGMLLPHLALGPGSRAGIGDTDPQRDLGPRLPEMTTEVGMAAAL